MDKKEQGSEMGICAYCSKEFEVLPNRKKYCSVDCLYKSRNGVGNGMYGRNHSELTRKKMSAIQKEVAPNVLKAIEYENMSEKKAERFLTKWKNSTVAFDIYFKNIHKSPVKMREVLNRFFPDEVSIHSDNLHCLNKLYKKGRSFEYYIMNKKKKEGYFCMRSAGSHSPIDIVAIKNGRIELIQAKAGCSLHKKERVSLLKLANSINAIPLFIQKIGRGKLREIDIRTIRNHHKIIDIDNVNKIDVLLSKVTSEGKRKIFRFLVEHPNEKFSREQIALNFKLKNHTISGYISSLKKDLLIKEEEKHLFVNPAYEEV
jgi:Holliday junction resolvase